jgi:hypothetical protein
VYVLPLNLEHVELIIFIQGDSIEIVINLDLMYHDMLQKKRNLQTIGKLEGLKKDNFTDNEIREIYQNGVKNLIEESIDDVDHQFSPADLVEERIISFREIEANSGEKDPTTLDVIDFESKKSLVIGVEGGYGGVSKHHYYLIEQDCGFYGVRYSDCLFNADLRGYEEQGF